MENACAEAHVAARHGATGKESRCGEAKNSRSQEVMRTASCSQQREPKNLCRQFRAKPAMSKLRPAKKTNHSSKAPGQMALASTAWSCSNPGCAPRCAKRMA